MSANARQEDHDEFTITSRREIVFYLRQLINDGERVSFMFNEGQDSILTILLDVDEENGLIYFDWGGSEETNGRFLKCQRCFFVASPQGVRNQFVAGTPQEVTYEGHRAFALPLPGKYLRLQRREFFRMVLPMTRRPPCRIQLGSPEVEHELSVIDIGLGGVALEAQVPTLPLTIGQVIPQAVIDLNGPQVMRFDLEVRYLGQVARGIRQAAFVGCKFRRVSAGQEQELQKFITQIQREERAKLG